LLLMLATIRCARVLWRRCYRVKALRDGSRKWGARHAHYNHYRNKHQCYDAIVSVVSDDLVAVLHTLRLCHMLNPVNVFVIPPPLAEQVASKYLQRARRRRGGSCRRRRRRRKRTRGRHIHVIRDVHSTRGGRRRVSRLVCFHEPDAEQMQIQMHVELHFDPGRSGGLYSSYQHACIYSRTVLIPFSPAIISR
jgi:hypothetical protein